MRFFTFTALLAAAVFSAGVAVPFLPAAKLRPDGFRIEAQVSSDSGGFLQIYYDDGDGFREDLSARANVIPTKSPVALRLPLPPRRYKALRIDPLEHGGIVTIHSLRILADSGRVIAQVPLDAVRAVQQVESLRPVGGALEIGIKAGSNDPQLIVTFPAPIEVKAPWADDLQTSALTVLPIFAALVALLFFLDRASDFRRKTVDRARRLAAHPGRAVCVVAAIAVVASAYPIVFLGKSYVSPRNTMG